MALDHYAPCPCGSGKKLKFCKCVDQPQEFEKIIRLIEGNQELAALDRINQLLAKTPNSAWLLALKGELTLSMEELDAFRETAVRFLKLKPDNPLALVMRSIAASLFGEPLDTSVRFLLEGLAESREGFPSLVVPAVQILSQALDENGFGALSGYWDDMLDTFRHSSEGERAAPQRELKKNLLVRSPAQLIDEERPMPWSERLNEVRSLTRVFRFALAETKLRSILRDYPDQPGPLSHLLRTQMVLVDQEGAVATARKLASVRELPQADRDYYLALAMELEVNQKSLTNPSVAKYCEIASEEQVSERLKALTFIDSMVDEDSAEVRRFYALTVNDEVPAKSLFHILDRSPTSDTSEPALVRSLGTIALFGKQTDRPARALLLAYRVPACQDIIDSAIEAFESIRDLDDPSAPRRYHLNEFLQRASFVGNADGTATQKSIQRASDLFISDFLNSPIDILGGQTPLQAVEDESKRATLRAILTHLEGEQSIIVEDRAIDEIYKQLQIDRPRIAIDPNAESLRLHNILDLGRIDVQSLNDKNLTGILSMALSIGAGRIIWRCSKEVLGRESLRHNDVVRAPALTSMIVSSTSLDEKLDLVTQLQDSVARLGKPIGQILLQRVGLLSGLGRHTEAQQLVQEGFRNHPNDPYLLSFYQYMTQNQSGIDSGADAESLTHDQLMMRRMRSRQDPHVAATQLPVGSESSSGLVLPGEAAASSGQTKSKLWLPGT